MAGDWIKMRGALTEHPKVIAVARSLQECQQFREWLTRGGGGPINGQLLSDEALRCVTCALLLRVWSRAREHGEYVGDDLVLRHNCIEDLDQLAGVPGIGKAMQRVGWAKTKNGVTLPNFKEYNVPLTPSEKQKAYRERRKNSVTARYQSEVTKNGKTLPLEKRREENKPTPIPPLVWSATGGWANVDAYRDNWREAYPLVDIDGELSRMSAWLLANPNKRKKRYAAFATNWLARSQRDAESKGGEIRLPRKSAAEVEADLRAVFEGDDD